MDRQIWFGLWCLGCPWLCWLQFVCASWALCAISAESPFSMTCTFWVGTYRTGAKKSASAAPMDWIFFCWQQGWIWVAILSSLSSEEVDWLEGGGEWKWSEQLIFVVTKFFHRNLCRGYHNLFFDWLEDGRITWYQQANFFISYQGPLLLWRDVHQKHNNQPRW